jgi:hypothetical protein
MFYFERSESIVHIVILCILYVSVVDDSLYCFPIIIVKIKVGKFELVGIKYLE